MLATGLRTTSSSNADIRSISPWSGCSAANRRTTRTLRTSCSTTGADACRRGGPGAPAGCERRGSLTAFGVVARRGRDAQRRTAADLAALQQSNREEALYDSRARRARRRAAGHRAGGRRRRRSADRGRAGPDARRLARRVAGALDRWTYRERWFFVPRGAPGRAMTPAGKMVAGRATAEGTRRYAEKLAARLAAGHFRELAGGASASTLGLGTYLGPEDGATDVQYQDAIVRALELGVNVLDTAVNYRHQRSERAIRTALATAMSRGLVRRDEVVVATKGGFIPFDGAVPRDPRAYFASTYVETGIIKPGEVAKGAHCMTPRYLRDQIDRSRANLGLETLDVYYVHNPETQLGEVDRAEFMARVRSAFGALEEAVSAGHIGHYGTATWTGYRVDPADPGYLPLAELVATARDVGGADHHFKVIQLPYNLGMTEAFTRANQRVKDRVVPVLEAARELRSEEHTSELQSQ